MTTAHCSTVSASHGARRGHRGQRSSGVVVLVCAHERSPQFSASVDVSARRRRDGRSASLRGYPSSDATHVPISASANPGPAGLTRDRFGHESVAIGDGAN